MKKIVFVRHAKAEKLTQPDFNRKLSKAGIKESELLGKSLKHDGFVCDLIISSDSARTFETAEIIGSYLDIKRREIQTEHKLYQGTLVETYYQILKTIPDKISNIIFVGHNTTLEDAVADMCPKFQQRMTTAAAVSIQYNVQQWNQVQPEKGKFDFYKFNQSKKRLGILEKQFIEKVTNEFYSEIEEVLTDFDHLIMLSDLESVIEKTSKTLKTFIKDTNIVTVRKLSSLENN